jgi:hypothetical protein
MKFFFYRGRFRRSYGDEELVIDEPARLVIIPGKDCSLCGAAWPVLAMKTGEEKPKHQSQPSGLWPGFAPGTTQKRKAMIQEP